MKCFRALTGSFFGFILLLLSFSCASNGSDQPLVSERNAAGTNDSTITLIFARNPNKKQSFTSTFNLDKEKFRQSRILGSMVSNTMKFSYLDDFYSEVNFSADNFGSADTIVLRSRKPLHLMGNAYPDKVQYYFLPGDTAVFSYGAADQLLTKPYKDIFTYPGEMASCRIINRNTKSQDLSYPFIKRALDGLYFFSTPYERYGAQKKQLDSIYKAGQLSDEYYTVYKSGLRYEGLSNLLVTAHPGFGEEFTPGDLAQDDLLPMQRYRLFLKNYVSEKIMQKKYIKVSNGLAVDFQKAYDSVNVYFKGKVRDYLLLECLEGIRHHQPKEVSESYLARFKKDVQDTAIQNYVADNYFISDDYSGKSMLTDISKKKTLDFTKMLEGHRGKVVYIDLWASWCAPCRALMPASEKLRAAYKTRPVVFVYLSLDQKYTAWKNAAVDERLDGYPESYLLINAHEAALPKKLALESIPRYLIINKAGKMVHQNAPGPDSEEIIKLLDKYLTQ